jgi:orotidine-5'-phosphate decarboxylase
MAQSELVIALDYSTPEPAQKLIMEMDGLPVIFKVGLELFMGTGPAWVKELTESGRRVFLDLKFHDIPNTVAQAVVQAAALGAEFTTVHLSGGKPMLDHIQTRLVAERAKGTLARLPKVLGVSVLTSFREEDWIANVSHVAKMSGIRSIDDSVMHFSDLAANHPALAGMVCSPKEVAAIRSKHRNLFLMVPGIRPLGGDTHDQARVVTPGEASGMGASAIVMGRPITQSANPRQTVESILKEIS